MTTWDRKDKPRGREFRRLASVVAQLDLDGLAPAAADAAIVVPVEWAKEEGEIARALPAGKEPAPYVSVEDSVRNPSKLESAKPRIGGGAADELERGRCERRQRMAGGLARCGVDPVRRC